MLGFDKEGNEPSALIVVAQAWEYKDWPPLSIKKGILWVSRDGNNGEGGALDKSLPPCRAQWQSRQRCRRTCRTGALQERRWYIAINRELESGLSMIPEQAIVEWYREACCAFAT